jgi:hypothetical protein
MSNHESQNKLAWTMFYGIAAIAVVSMLFMAVANGLTSYSGSIHHLRDTGSVYIDRETGSLNYITGKASFTTEELQALYKLSHEYDINIIYDEDERQLED